MNIRFFCLVLIFFVFVLILDKKHKERISRSLTGGIAISSSFDQIVYIYGSSCSGKSTILKQFIENDQNYDVYITDDMKQMHVEKEAVYYENYHNEFSSDSKKEDFSLSFYINYCKKHGTKNNIILDGPYVPKKLDDNICSILVYTPFEDILNNMNARQTTEFRPMAGVLYTFCRLYHGVTDNKEMIDTINKKAIGDLFLRTCKYFFENEEKLNNYLYNFWKNLGVLNTDKIGLRYPEQNVIKTQKPDKIRKTKEEIYIEAKKLVEEFYQTETENIEP